MVFRDTVTVAPPWMNPDGELYVCIKNNTGAPTWVPAYKVARQPVNEAKDGPRFMVKLPPFIISRR